MEGRNSLALAGILDSSFISSSRKVPPCVKFACGNGRERAGVIEVVGLCDVLGAMEEDGDGLSGELRGLCLGCGRGDPEVGAGLETGVKGGSMGWGKAARTDSGNIA